MSKFEIVLNFHMRVNWKKIYFLGVLWILVLSFSQFDQNLCNSTIFMKNWPAFWKFFRKMFRLFELIDLIKNYQILPRFVQKLLNLSNFSKNYSFFTNFSKKLSLSNLTVFINNYANFEEFFQKIMYLYCIIQSFSWKYCLFFYNFSEKKNGCGPINYWICPIP